MIEDSKYRNYTVEEFVEDEDFRRWVEAPNEILTIYWKQFLEEFPEQEAAVKHARLIVETLLVKEEAPSPEVYKHSLDALKDHLRNKNQQEQKWIQRRRFIWQSAAAVLLIPMLAISVYWLASNVFSDSQSQMVNYIVPNGQKSQVILADGTKVWLNSGSQLSYAANPRGKYRKVNLEGEAYFEVVKNTHRPFLVQTKDYSVKVYGTKFNVRTYDDFRGSETILKEGSISILSKHHDEIKMTPGDRFLFTGNNQYTLSKVDPDLYLSWKDNVLKIDNETLTDLIVRMERWYGVKINVKNFDVVKDLRYTLTIKTESLREMLDLMRFVTPFNYSIKGENVELNYEI